MRQIPLREREAVRIEASARCRGSMHQLYSLSNEERALDFDRRALAKLVCRAASRRCFAARTKA